MDLPLTIPTLINSAAGLDQQAAALVAPSRAPLSYEALQRQTVTTAAALRQASVGGRDRVAVVLPNGPEMAAAVLAVASGAICAPLNPSYGEQELRFYLTDLKARALLLPAGYRGAARAVADALGVLCLEVGWEVGWPAGRFELIGGGAPTRSGEGAGTRQPDDVALVLHTSGTTSRPKIVPLSHGNLCSSAHNVARTLELSPRDRCLSVMPLFHIHGIVAALLGSLASGGSVACVPGYRDGQFLVWLAALQPSWYTAVPTVHQAILTELAHHPAGAAAKRLRFARSSSAPLPLAVMRELEGALQVPVVEAYGMTEAAHQIASTSLPPGERKPKSVGMAAGPVVAIMDDEGRLLPAGATGEIVIRGNNVTAGYDNNPEANAKAFVAGWFRTGDQGYVDTDGYLYITGRIKEIINRGGEKVSPGEVDEALLEHAAVRQAVAFGVPHATLGEDVAAAVVLKDGATETADQIRAFLFGRLAEFKIPSQLVIVDEIPKGATGKIQRIGLEAKFAERLKPAFVAPRDATEAQVAAIFAEVLGIGEVGAFDNFFALGGDSLRGFQALARIRARLQVDLSIVDLFKAPTVAQSAQEVSRARREAEKSALERILSDVELLSDEEAARQLDGERRGP
jgi:acyl-CoA synthetase (AMP-forming)/AMP-acid ligase II/aryl carrier-like protein